MNETPDDDDDDDDIGTDTVADGTLPEELRDLNAATSLPELVARYFEADYDDRMADFAKYIAMMTRLMVARLAWAHFSRRHAAAKTPSDRAQATIDFCEWGKDELDLKTAQLKKYRRLSEFIEEIHSRTVKERAAQKAADEELTYPSLATLNNAWFPSDPDGQEESRKARVAEKELKEARDNMAEEDRRNEVMAAHDAKITAEKKLQAVEKRVWDADTRYNRALAERDARIAEQAALITALRARLAALTELPPDDDAPELPPGPGGGSEPPAEPEPEPEPPAEPEPEPEPKPIYWAEMTKQDMTVLYRRVLPAKDLSDLTDEAMDIEEDEYGIRRRGAALKDKAQNRAARRLRLLCVRICIALGNTDAKEKLSMQSKKWFAERLFSTPEALARAVTQTIKGVDITDTE